MSLHGEEGGATGGGASGGGAKEGGAWESERLQGVVNTLRESGGYRRQCATLGRMYAVHAFW